jgi:hypothetical protein
MSRFSAGVEGYFAKRGMSAWKRANPFLKYLSLPFVSIATDGLMHSNGQGRARKLHLRLFVLLPTRSSSFLDVEIG